MTAVSMGFADDNCSSCHIYPPEQQLSRSASLGSKAVGVMDKGQLQVNTSNFGDMADFHVWFTNSVHWPRTAADNRQYGFGIGLVAAINDTNVIETVTQAQVKVQDWLPLNESPGRLFSGDIRASDETPFQASSDLLLTWPYGFYDDALDWNPSGSRHWPGEFRTDVNSLDSTTLTQHPPIYTQPQADGQFTSDRDVFSIYNDDYNTRGRVGLEVEQSAYSYGRPYAEDFAFWHYTIYNTSGEDLEDIYLGFYVKLRPDYDWHDYLNFIDSDGDGIRDLVYVYDLDNQKSGTWGDTDDPLGMVGLRVYDTPGQIGITDFHHFHREFSPTTDEGMWALMTSQMDTVSLHDPSFYFHGDDVHFDDTSLENLENYYPSWLDEETGVDFVGAPINYVISCGPFTLAADSLVSLSMGLIMGDAGDTPFAPDTTDLMNNVRTANEMYRLYFQGSGPPDPPAVHAVAGDQEVTLYWSADPSENSIDLWTNQQDFEGYRIYRSSDYGLSWGDPITDMYGNVVGYVPIAQFDYTEEEDMLRYGFDVSGVDPYFNQNLGENTGLAHQYTDEDLVNGVEYWYCVSAYDHGNPDPENPEQSFMNALGASPYESHTVAVTPGVTANDLVDGLNYGELVPQGGRCSGTVRLEIEDAEALKDHGYKLSFTNDAIASIDGADTTYGLGYTLVDTTTMDVLVENRYINSEVDTNYVSVDGFLLYLKNSEGGIQSIGWTEVSGDTCTFDWRTDTKWPELIPTGQVFYEDIQTVDDWRITVNYENGDSVRWFDAFSGNEQSEKQYVPIRIEVVTDPDNPIDVTRDAWLADFAIAAPWEGYRKDFYSPLGWDLEPGGAGYLPGSPGWYEKHVDFFIFEKIDIDPATGDTLPNYMYFYTNNKPDSSKTKDNQWEIIDARAPSDGDQFTILTYKPFRPGIQYTFGIQPDPASPSQDENSLSDLRVVPDPYIVTNVWETNEFGKKLQFNHLPSRCTIQIYTLVGERIATVNHDSPAGYAFWDMRTDNDQFIAPGTYLYFAETPEGHTAKGRFLVIR